jgi:multiple sugar transport system permease protein
MRRQRTLTSALIYVALLAGAVVMMLPLLYTIATALKPNAFVFEPRFWPENPTFDNFVRAWNANNFQLYFLNSLKIAIVTTVLTVFVAATQAYAFARMRFPGKDVLFTIYLITMMIPGMLLIIPQFIQARSFGLINTHLGLILIYVVGSIPFQTFLLRAFFERIPRELEEAAYIDGASRFGTFWRIAVPLAAPGLGTAAIFAFLGSWDEFTWALTIISDVDLRTLPIAIRMFQGQNATQWGLVFAAALIAIVPVMVVFVAFQRTFVKGIAAGGVKG